MLKYTNIEASTFAAYCLPAVPVPPLADETEISGKKNIRTKAEEWTKVDDNNGLPVVPIPYTDGNEDVSLNITAAEIKGMKDASGDIRFHKVIEYLLPRFKNSEVGQQSLWEWQAARMRNYMKYLVMHHGYKPK